MQSPAVQYKILIRLIADLKGGQCALLACFTYPVLCFCGKTKSLK